MLNRIIWVLSELSSDALSCLTKRKQNIIGSFFLIRPKNGRIGKPVIGNSDGCFILLTLRRRSSEGRVKLYLKPEGKGISLRRKYKVQEWKAGNFEGQERLFCKNSDGHWMKVWNFAYSSELKDLTLEPCKEANSRECIFKYQIPLGIPLTDWLHACSWPGWGAECQSDLPSIACQCQWQFLILLHLHQLWNGICMPLDL